MYARQDALHTFYQRYEWRKVSSWRNLRPQGYASYEHAYKPWQRWQTSRPRSLVNLTSSCKQVFRVGWWITIPKWSLWCGGRIIVLNLRYHCPMTRKSLKVSPKLSNRNSKMPGQDDWFVQRRVLKSIGKNSRKISYSGRSKATEWRYRGGCTNRRTRHT